MLFWSQEQRDDSFRRMETLAPVNVIRAGGTVRSFGEGAAIGGIDFDGYMSRQRNAGLIVVQDGAIRFEDYALGYDRSGRWTSFSVAKSFTSTLVGAAVADGYIASLDDPVTRYVPDLTGPAYEGVTVRQLLTMTSGADWTEDYADSRSNVAQFALHVPDDEADITVSYMRTLERAAEPGMRWLYNTGETNLIGVVVSRATGRTLSDYLSQKIWQPFGMEHDAVWMTGSTGHEVSGCCISASLRDYARFGCFVLDGGGGVVPDGWFAAATSKQQDIGQPSRGYGYQWWTNDDGSFAAQGIFGQGIFIDPHRRLVIASNGNWPVAKDDATVGADRELFYKSVQAAVDQP